mmetsp:Transcript_32574/g.56406  ORF Transcript_32574/g.56406 Transcript_32574/m.56406 type:complete len:192 (+) Transcript_32574:789-1364(+)
MITRHDAPSPMAFIQTQAVVLSLLGTREPREAFRSMAAGGYLRQFEFLKLCHTQLSLSYIDACDCLWVFGKKKVLSLRDWTQICDMFSQDDRSSDDSWDSSISPLDISTHNCCKSFLTEHSLVLPNEFSSIKENTMLKTPRRPTSSLDFADGFEWVKAITKDYKKKQDPRMLREILSDLTLDNYQEAVIAT